jgi:hypothetical protein
MRVAIATCTAVPPGFDDDVRLAEELGRRGLDVARIAWDAPDARWDTFDAVVIRSTWDYPPRRTEFLAWADAVGPRLHNSPALVRWNSDKRYLADLAAAGVPVVPTTFVAPGEPVPELRGEVVVKPSVSAGARDTGRFSERTHQLARELVARIQAGGRTAMVQPYLPAVDSRGETAVVCIDGEPLHTLHKHAVLRADEVAPVRADDLGAAEAMYDPDLVVPGEAEPAELDLVLRVLEDVTARFRRTPLYARVDMVRGDDGAPVLLELEAVEPNLYLDVAPASLGRVADAIVSRAAAPPD